MEMKKLKDYLKKSKNWKKNEKIKTQINEITVKIKTVFYVSILVSKSEKWKWKKSKNWKNRKKWKKTKNLNKKIGKK